VSVLGIHVLGSGILRQETTPIAAVTDAIRQLVDDMFETMYAAKGIGLAAPQVGRTERITVIDVDREGNQLHPLVLINPTITLREGTVRGEEGCLSIPDIYGDVERASRIIVHALDREGAPFEMEATELLARCVQHEIDHLHGKLFIDYLGIFKRRAALAKWEEEKVKYPSLVRTIVPASVIADHHDPAREDEEM
jgi:peptide deformylase